MKHIILILILALPTLSLKGGHKDKQLDGWINSLASSNQSTVQEAMDNLCSSGKRALTKLIDSAKSNSNTLTLGQWTKEHTIRMRSILLLSSFKDVRIAPALISIIKSPKEQLHFRATAALELGKCEPSASTETILILLMNNQLKNLPKKFTVNVCSPTSKPRYLQNVAAISLGKLKTETARKALANTAINTKNELKLRLAALTSLSGFNNNHELIPLLKTSVSKYASDQKDTNVQALVFHTVLALSHTKDIKSSKLLYEIANSNLYKPRIRHLAIQSLALMKHPELVKKLEPLLESRLQLIRLSSAAAIISGNASHSAAINVLCNAASNRQIFSTNRAYAVISLGLANSTKKVLDTLKTCYFSEPDAVIRLNAANALGHFDESISQPILLKGFSNHQPFVSAEAVGYLMAHKKTPELTKVFAKLSRHREPYLRKKAIIALEGHKSDMSFKAIRRALRDKDINVRRMAILSAGMLNQPKAFAREFQKIKNSKDSMSQIYLKQIQISSEKKSPTEFVKNELLARRSHVTGPGPQIELQQLQDMMFRRVLKIDSTDLDSWRRPDYNLVKNTMAANSASDYDSHIDVNVDETFLSYTTYSTCGGRHDPVKYIMSKTEKGFIITYENVNNDPGYFNSGVRYTFEEAENNKYRIIKNGDFLRKAYGDRGYKVPYKNILENGDYDAGLYDRDSLMRWFVSAFETGDNAEREQYSTEDIQKLKLEGGKAISRVELLKYRKYVVFDSHDPRRYLIEFYGLGKQNYYIRRSNNIGQRTNKGYLPVFSNQ